MGSTAGGSSGSVYARHPVSTLVGVNAALFPLVLAMLEVLLRVSGARTLAQQRVPGEGSPHKAFCDAERGQPSPVSLPFITDSEGIFKANKDFAFEASPRWAGLGIHINSDGFRGREFMNRRDRSRPTILLLGDSFAWGASARPLSKCFADRLDHAGYDVFNSGIPGVDPTQYARIAEKYVPKLRPDITAVFVYLGNDILPAPTVVEPTRNLWYVTNSEFLLGYDEFGNYFPTPGDALRYYKRTYCGEYRGATDFFLYRTVIGSAVQEARTRWRQAGTTDPGRAWVRRSLSRIQSACVLHRSRFLLFLIPTKPSHQNETNSPRDNLGLFDGLEPHFPRRVREQDYGVGDDHLNNQGHKRYFQFVLKVLGGG